MSAAGQLLTAGDRAAFELVGDVCKTTEIALVLVHPLFKAALLDLSASSLGIVPELGGGRESGEEGRETLIANCKAHAGAKMEARQEPHRCEVLPSYRLFSSL